MRQTVLSICVLVMIAFTYGCSSDSSSNIGSVTNNLATTLKVSKWGPEEAKIGNVPNKQPDGKMGLWIDVETTKGIIGDIQVIFDGKPTVTAVQQKLISAGISPEELSKAGDKKIEIKSVATGEIFPVGTFKVIP